MEKIGVVLPRRSDPLAGWRRDVLCRSIASARGPACTVTEVEAELRTATPPMSSSTASSLYTTRTDIDAFLESLRLRSATAQLFANAMPVDLNGYAQVNLPRMATLAQPAWTLEGDPIPALQGTFANATIGPLKKLAAITSLTGELFRATAGKAASIIETAMLEVAGQALDASFFSTAAATSARPAGILNGVSPITATAGGGVAALVGDVKALAAAIGNAGGGKSVMFFASPGLRAAASAWSGGGFSADEIIPTAALPAGTIVAIEAGAIAFSVDGLPKVDVSKETTIHMEDTTPQQIATVGTPNVVAAPVRSLFQTDSVALRLIMRCAWAVRGPNLVQVINSVTW